MGGAVGTGVGTAAERRSGVPIATFEPAAGFWAVTMSPSLIFRSSSTAACSSARRGEADAARMHSHRVDEVCRDALDGLPQLARAGVEVAARVLRQRVDLELAGVEEGARLAVRADAVDLAAVARAGVYRIADGGHARGQGRRIRSQHAERQQCRGADEDQLAVENLLTCGRVVNVAREV